MRRWSGTAVLAAGALAAASIALAADVPLRPDFGKREYDSNCASCHGLAGKGDGPFKDWMTRKPSDLSVLAKQNGGVFPFDRVVKIIDGRQDVAAHGTRDMPVWGRDYALQAGAYYYEMPYDAEAYVRARVLALADYLNRLQVK